jgi:hypothetical protein
VLYQCVEQHWDAFVERAEQAGGLPRFVTREFEAPEPPTARPLLPLIELV